MIASRPNQKRPATTALVVVLAVGRLRNREELCETELLKHRSSREKRAMGLRCIDLPGSPLVIRPRCLASFHRQHAWDRSPKGQVSWCNLIMFRSTIPISGIEKLASFPGQFLYEQAYTAVENRDWGTYFASFPSEDNSRLKAFVWLAPYLDDREYWDSVRNIWTGSELLSDDESLWRFILSARSSHELLLTPYNRQLLWTKLPSEVTIYRGFSVCYQDGLSWTLSRKTAEFFAEYSADGPRRCSLFGPQPDVVPQIVTGQCRSCDIIAIFSDRKEREVVIFPENVKNKRVEVWIPKPKLERKPWLYVAKPISLDDIAKVA